MNLDLIKELRARTHISLNECKTALAEANGDLEAAFVVLQKRGLAKAGQIAGRTAGEGKVFSYVHGGKIAVLVEVNCETDFAAKSPLFLEFGENLAMHVAAMNAPYLKSEDIPAEIKDEQLAIFTEQSRTVGMPGDRLLLISEGKFKKWCSEVCLMNQSWIHDQKKTVEDVRTALIASLGENIVVRRIIRWEVGGA